MTESILPGLYRIPVPLPGNPLKELNAYLLRGNERSILIDTGFRQEECRSALFAGLEELGCQGQPVDVLLTHLHSDHSGLAVEAAGEQGHIYISGIDRSSLADEAARQMYWALSQARFLAEGFPQDMLDRLDRTNPARSMAPPPVQGPYAGLEDGQLLELDGWKLRCLLMPGHTPGQMCFWLEEQGVLFTGDHVLFDITPNITSWPALSDALGAYLNSLDKILPYGNALALPGHRKGGSVPERVEALKRHHTRRLEEALEAVRRHPGTGAYELAGYMTWKIRAASWAEFPETQKWFAVGECMAHLDHLMALGEVRRSVENGRNTYWTA